VYIVDIEANGLLDTVDKIWCIVVYNVEDSLLRYDSAGEVINRTEFIRIYTNEEFNPDIIPKHAVHHPLSHFPVVWCGKEMDIAMHNGIGYDRYVLNKVLGLPINRPIYDTLLVSRALDPDRTWGHSVEGWGKKLKMHKVQNDKWDEWDPLILERCIQDVKIQAEIYKELQKEIEFNKKLYEKMKI